MSEAWRSGGDLALGSAGGGDRGGPPVGEVHVWQAVLGRGAGGPGDRSLLAADELARAEAFAFEELGRSWVWARATLRRVLGGYLGDRPRAVALSYGEHGKPRIGGSDLAFNLSHSGRRLVIAVSRGQVLGVDVERVSRCIDALALADRYFAPAEALRLRALPAGRRAAAFAAVWSAKEAYAKALGCGLTAPLRDFEVTGEADGPAVLATAPGDPRGPADWVLAQTRPAPDYVCTLAVAARRLVLVDRREAGADG